LVKSFSAVVEVIWTLDPLERAPEVTAKPIPEEPPTIYIGAAGQEEVWVGYFGGGIHTGPVLCC
jgi:hypothetical protein